MINEELNKKTTVMFKLKFKRSNGFCTRESILSTAVKGKKLRLLMIWGKMMEL